MRQPSVLRGSDSYKIFKRLAEIKLVSKTSLFTDRKNGQVCCLQELLGNRDPVFFDIFRRRTSGMLMEYFCKIRLGKSELFRQKA